MSLVSGFPHHPVMHHHDSHHYSLHAAAAGRCHEDTGAPPYFTSWLISHADMSPTEYSLAPGYSPEYHGNSGGGSTGGLDPHHHHHHHYGTGGLVPGAGAISVNGAPVGMHHHHHTHPRPVKRRPTANRKERRRTQSINSAFAELRECIPNVPADTKLSKIKTLRLATSYISYLMDILDKDGQHGDTQAFKAELKKTEAREERRKRDTWYGPIDQAYITAEPENWSPSSDSLEPGGARFSQRPTTIIPSKAFSPFCPPRPIHYPRSFAPMHSPYPVEIPKTASSSSSSSSSSSGGDKKTKGRTGWPQHVWALELKQ